MTSYFVRRDGNAEKMEINSLKRVVREGTADAKREEAKAKKVKVTAAKVTASIVHDELMCRMEMGRDRQLVHLLLHGMTAAVEVRSLIAGVPMTHPNVISVDSDDDKIAVMGTTTPKLLSGTVVECDRALYEIVAKKPVAMKAELKGLQYNTRTWEHRAAGAFLFLHPGIYGQSSFSERTEKVGAAIGVEAITLRPWFSLHNKQSKENTERWPFLVKNMTGGHRRRRMVLRIS